MNISESEARCFLQLTLHFGKSDITSLLTGFTTASDALLAPEHELRGILTDFKIDALIAARDSSDVRAPLASLTAAGIGYCPSGHPGYPNRLSTIPDAPAALFYRGKLPDVHRPSVAIIGARNCSGYGRQMAREFSRAVAEAGIQVISGMALGIDGIAQQSALDVHGETYGVLGCGVDICYPPANRELYDTLCDKCGILSEYPPGMKPNARLFPARNRIISGLSDAVLVIEARERSGTLITVNMALEQGRDVYALPGRINESLSYGCNMLIHDGATPLLRPDEFVDEFFSRLDSSELYRDLRIASQGVSTHQYDNSPVADDMPNSLFHMQYNDIFLRPDEKVIMSVLDYTPKTTSEIFYDISDKCDMSLPKLMQTLTEMTMRHKIRCIDGCNYYVERK